MSEKEEEIEVGSDGEEEAAEEVEYEDEAPIINIFDMPQNSAFVGLKVVNLLMLCLMGLARNNSFFYESDILLHFCSSGWIRGGGGVGWGEGHLRRLKGGEAGSMV